MSDYKQNSDFNEEKISAVIEDLRHEIKTRFETIEQDLTKLKINKKLSSHTICEAQVDRLESLSHKIMSAARKLRADAKTSLLNKKIALDLN